MAAGEAAKAHNSTIVILVDEIQNLNREDFGALIMAVHHANQQQLPILVVGAGLPSIVKLCAESRSYAERLFEYPDVGALNDEACRRVLAEPAVREGVEIEDSVIVSVTDISKGYPYFLQEWGTNSGWRPNNRQSQFVTSGPHSIPSCSVSIGISFAPVSNG